MKKILTFSFASALVAALTTSAQAQALATFSSGTFLNNSVLSLTGTTAQELYGVNFGPTTVTTGNGYTFDSSSITSHLGTYGTSVGYGGMLPSPATTGDAAFNSIIAYADVNGGGSGGSLILQGLVAGMTYNALFLNADDRSGIDGPRTLSISDGTDSITGMEWRGPGGSPDIGSYILATFTAVGPTEHFTLSGPGGPQLNDLLVGTATVPEPSTYALAVCSGIGMFFFRRKK
jgi:hypothetical protein